MKFAALGRTSWLYDSIKACAEQGHEPVFIGTAAPAPEYSVDEQGFAFLAQKYGCSFLADAHTHKSECLAMIHKATPTIAISMNWPVLIRKDLLEAFPLGVINAHAGDLPRFRGNACPNWAILAGEKQVVVTLHRMTEELDAGPIFLQRLFPINHDTYIGDIYSFLDTAVPSMFADVLNGLENGTTKPVPQPPEPIKSLRCFPRLPADGFIDWNRSAEELVRLIRATAEPFPGAYSHIGSEKLIIWRARADSLAYPYLGVPGQVVHIDRQRREVTVLTGQHVLVLEQVEVCNGGRVCPTEVISSSQTRLGLNTTEQLLELNNRIHLLENRITAIVSGQCNGRNVQNPSAD